MNLFRKLIKDLREVIPKATPGPWYPGCLGTESTCQCPYVCDEGHAGGICTVHVDNKKLISEGGNGAPSKEEATANMKLIALCSPDNVLALLLYIEGLEDTLKKIQENLTNTLIKD